jgi:hypothetical protein
METMTRLGRDRALSFLEEMTATIGTCEHCEKNTKVFTHDGCAYLECMPCKVEELRYWENRIGSIAEYVFDGYAPRVASKGSRAYRVALSTYFATLMEEGK